MRSRSNAGSTWRIADLAHPRRSPELGGPLPTDAAPQVLEAVEVLPESAPCRRRRRRSAAARIGAIRSSRSRSATPPRTSSRPGPPSPADPGGSRPGRPNGKQNDAISTSRRCSRSRREPSISSHDSSASASPSMRWVRVCEPMSTSSDFASAFRSSQETSSYAAGGRAGSGTPMRRAKSARQRSRSAGGMRFSSARLRPPSVAPVRRVRARTPTCPSTASRRCSTARSARTTSPGCPSSRRIGRAKRRKFACPSSTVIATERAGRHARRPRVGRPAPASAPAGSDAGDASAAGETCAPRCGRPTPAVSPQKL